VVCYRCSASRHAIPRHLVVENPVSVHSDVDEPRLRRVCDSCVPRVITLSISGSESPTTTTMTVPPASVATEMAIGTPASSEVDDAFLIECPVCRLDLRDFGDEDLQAIHVATCLEGHGTSPSFSGGSRHLGTLSSTTSPLTSVYRLPEGSPLIGTECVICFEEFEVLSRNTTLLMEGRGQSFTDRVSL
jgi:hypothetical protein